VRDEPRPRPPAPRAREPRRVAFEALLEFSAQPDARILECLHGDGLEPRDQALAREIALGVVRRRDLLDHIALGFAPRGLPARAEARMALRIGIYQLAFLERIPPHAAVDTAVELVDGSVRGFVNAVLRRVAEQIVPKPDDDDARPRADRLVLPGERVLRLGLALPHPETDTVRHLALLGSLPAFLAKRWFQRHGAARAFELVDATLRPAAVALRTVRCTRDELAAALHAEGVETTASEHPRVLIWSGGVSPFASTAWKQGRFVAQDPTAVAAAEALGAQSGETVLDLCAAPGTKATLLAEAVGESGVVLAYDPDAKRRAKIVDNVVRLGLSRIRILEDVARGAGADRVIVDAPCSNTGVLARRVEVRHRLDTAGIADLAAQQRSLLGDALALVRVGGVVVYSTCSIEREENEAVVEAALAEGGVELVEQRMTWPDPPRHDGGYFAVLRRND
jgi:16S rRNA (cytosine967-C5)-methyltransferase